MFSNRKNFAVFFTFLIMIIGVSLPCFAGKKNETNYKSASVVVHVNADTFDQTISQGVVLVDFFADWCGPCRRFAPIFEKVAEDMAGVVLFAKLNVDDGKAILGAYNVSSFPTLVLFKDGKEVSRREGGCDAQTLRVFIEQGL